MVEARANDRKPRPPRRAAASKARWEVARPAPHRRAPCPIVAMGASAGGLEAFEKFFTRVDPNCGLAFVLVPHLDAHHKSAMTELVQRFTRMKVTEISDGMPVMPDRVHVIPLSRGKPRPEPWETQS
jgi:chemotaxis response regulator CheB